MTRLTHAPAPRFFALLLGAAAVAASAFASPPSAAPPVPAEARQFDFWLGTWSVNNRRQQPDGSWRDEGRAEARIESILGGRAVLERWTGQGGYPVFGFSVRAWDPARERWVIVLNWPGGGRPPRFSAMEGTFRHGRGEFFPPGYDGTWPQATRFTFADGLADSCRWDMAQTTDGGLSWRTSWIMEFTRIADPGAINATNASIDQPPASSPCTDPRARAADDLIGAWTGTVRIRGSDGQLRDGAASFRSSSMIKGCGQLHFLDCAVDGAITRRFMATAFDFAGERWNARFLDERTPRFRSLSGAAASDGERLVLTEEGDGADRRRITLGRTGDELRWTEEAHEDGAWEVLLEATLGPAESGPQALAEPGVDHDGVSSTIAPEPRSGLAAVWDEHRERLVVQGGRGSEGRLADTWTWSATAGWSILEGSGPGPLSDHQAVYDAARREVVLFGGLGAQGRSDATWILDESGWQQRAVAGPAPRSLHAMAWDDVREQVVLHGGVGANRTSLGDTWTWNGTAWTQHEVTGPGARGAHVMTWHPELEAVVLVGGYTDGALAEAWAWDGRAWSRPSGDAPPANLHFALGHDATRQRLVMHGGFDEAGRSSATWEWDGASWTSVTAAAAPVARAEHEGVFLPGRGVLVFGGVVGQDMAADDRVRTAELRLFDGRAWIDVPASGLPAWNERCPKSGKPVRSDAYFEHDGVRVYFCNLGCAEEGARDPGAWIERAYADGLP